MTHDFKLNGDKVRELMIITMEECGELTQACSKVIRTMMSESEIREDVLSKFSINKFLGSGQVGDAWELDENKILNDSGLRFSDEFVRHKVLDFIGDISLSGYRILGSFYTSHCGHDLNLQLLKKIFESSDNWELICSN